MRLVTGNGRVWQGTPLQVVRGMQAGSMYKGLPFRQYVDKVVERALEVENVVLAVYGETDDELAASLVRAMVGAGLAEELP